MYSNKQNKYNRVRLKDLMVQSISNSNNLDIAIEVIEAVYELRLSKSSKILKKSLLIISKFKPHPIFVTSSKEHEQDTI